VVAAPKDVDGPCWRAADTIVDEAGVVVVEAGADGKRCEYLGPPAVATAAAGWWWTPLTPPLDAGENECDNGSAPVAGETTRSAGDDRKPMGVFIEAVLAL